MEVWFRIAVGLDESAAEIGKCPPETMTTVFRDRSNIEYRCFQPGGSLSLRVQAHCGRLKFRVELL